MASLQPDFTLMFDNFNLQDIPYLTFVKRDPNGDAGRTINTRQPIGEDGEVPVSTSTGPRFVPVIGYILAPTRQDYENTLDELKFRLDGVARPLVLQQGNKLRSYVASKDSLDTQFIESGKTRVLITFKCHKPHGRDTIQTVYEETITVASKILDHTITGSAAAKPYVKVTIDDMTDGTNTKVRIGNSSTGQGIAVTRTWSDDDVLIVDFERKKVFVNDESINYDGSWPKFEARTQTIMYSDEFSARDVDVQVIYNSKYQ